MKKDLSEDFSLFSEAHLPQLQRTAFTKLGGRPVHRYTSNHHGAFRLLKEPNLRVSTLGRTFLDMLREPALCGGILHVLNVFRDAANSYLRLILDEIDQHGGDIDKVRAGFILEELCKTRDPRIDSWTAFAKRGGSRKLDASTEYSPQFSERWSLSINVTMPSEWTQ
jgi:predicted transcriptional regulator of viral defense system